MSERRSRVPVKAGFFTVPDDPGEPPRLLGSRCDDCGEHFFPRRAVCAKCGARDRMRTKRLANEGTLHTYSIVHRSFPGVAVPYVSAVVDLTGGGSLAPGPFVAAVTANPLTTVMTWDVYIAAAAASLWMVADARRRGLRGAWIHVALTFAVGLAFAFPLYLARRERLDVQAAGRVR